MPFFPDFDPARISVVFLMGFRILSETLFKNMYNSTTDTDKRNRLLCGQPDSDDGTIYAYYRGRCVFFCITSFDENDDTIIEIREIDCTDGAECCVLKRKYC